MSSSTTSGRLVSKYRFHAMLIALGTFLLLLSAFAFQHFNRPTYAAPSPFLFQSGSSAKAKSGIDVFFGLTAHNDAVVDESLKIISENWHPGSTTILVEISQFARSRQALAKIYSLVEAKTGQRFGIESDDWNQWIWKQDYAPHPQYAQFKKTLYERIDPRFAEYYRITKDSKIRLDEIRWGGVIRDGIPPLKDPKMLAAADANYLADSDVVFGVDLNGDARCYPKRILAWHEMFKDTIGGESVCGVY